MPKQPTLSLSSNQAPPTAQNGGKPGLETTEPQRPDLQSGGPGNQNDARLAMFNDIADRAEAGRADELVDVTDAMYANPPGTGDDDAAPQPPEAAAPAAEAAKESTAPLEPTAAPAEPTETPRRLKLKINGAEQEFDEAEVIARAQKVSAADQYLAEAAKIYQEAARTPSPSAQDTTPAAPDFAALAQAIQLGTTDEAVQALKSLYRPPSPSDDGIRQVVQREMTALEARREGDRFLRDYGAFMKDDEFRAQFDGLDAYYAGKGEPMTYERLKKTAEKLGAHLEPPAQDLEAKRERKASVRPVTGGSLRQAVQPEEPEPTASETIAEIAKARGQAGVRSN